MGRHAKYGDNLERQAAYRERVRERQLLADRERERLAEVERRHLMAERSAREAVPGLVADWFHAQHGYCPSWQELREWLSLPGRTSPFEQVGNNVTRSASKPGGYEKLGGASNG